MIHLYILRGSTCLVGYFNDPYDLLPEQFKNPLRMCFKKDIQLRIQLFFLQRDFRGYGQVYERNIHHRFNQKIKTTLSGCLFSVPIFLLCLSVRVCFGPSFILCSRLAAEVFFEFKGDQKLWEYVPYIGEDSKLPSRIGTI